MKTNPIPKGFIELVKRYSRLSEVQGILLAGSRVTNTSDSESDYDLYIYLNKDISIGERKAITTDLFDDIEVNNQFWETEDDGYLREGHIPVDIVYRDLDFLIGNLRSKLEFFQADVGYTTCIWANFISSEILFERNGIMSSLQSRYKIPYPRELKMNIIRKNYPLLKQQLPAYYYQIEKALKRRDIISINHRVAGFFASLFDILFALNDIPHPGEKKLLRIIKEQCRKVPEHWEETVIDILSKSGSCDPTILTAMDTLIQKLDHLLAKEKIAI